MQTRLDSLWVDWYTAQAVRALLERGLEPILLKGPAIARWLYPHNAGARSYLDADLLVAPDAIPLAEQVLAELGFQVEELPWLDAERPHAKSWRRSDGAVIDLHRAPLGCERLDPVMVWRTWRAGAEMLEVGELGVLVPAIPVRLLGLMLAIRPGLDDRAHELADLERALDTVKFGSWLEAAALAGRLGTEREAGYSLSRSSAGVELGARLGLPATPTLRLLLDADPLLRAAGHLVRIRGTRAKLRYLKHRLLPPPAYVRECHPRPVRFLGDVGAYLAWAVHALAGVPRALVVSSRAMHDSVDTRRESKP